MRTNGRCGVVLATIFAVKFANWFSSLPPREISLSSFMYEEGREEVLALLRQGYTLDEVERMLIRDREPAIFSLMNAEKLAWV